MSWVSDFSDTFNRAPPDPQLSKFTQIDSDEMTVAGLLTVESNAIYGA